MAQLLTLDDNEVHIWRIDISQVDLELLPSYFQLMSEQEKQRNRRFRFEHSRITDVISRSLVRTVLSRYADIEPADWTFSQGEYGKPEVSNKDVSLRFNLSHSSKMVACAVGRRHAVGLDIEYINRKNDVLAIADRYFSTLELKALFALPIDQQRDRFFDYWTLKEAYMKADGRGIGLGLANFSFTIAGDEQITISFNDKIKEDPARWCFRLFYPAPDHRMALAVQASQHGLVIRQFDEVDLIESIR